MKFLQNTVTVFDQAVQFEKSLHDDLDRIAENEEAYKALNTIRLITMVQTGSRFNYNRIRELNPLMDTVRTAHDKMLEEKRAEVLELFASVWKQLTRLQMVIPRHPI